MAQAKKLSEALSELSNDSSISGDERIVVSDTDGVARTIPAKQLIERLNESDEYLATLKKTFVGNLGSFDDWDSFSKMLDNQTKENTKNGKYISYVGGVPVFVTFEIRHSASNVLGQWVEGPATASTDGGKLITSSSRGVFIVSRIYQNNAWGKWQRVAYADEIPQKVTTTSDGLMSKEDKSSIDKITTNTNAFTIKQGDTNADSVLVCYSSPYDGKEKRFNINGATSDSAGVMKAEQVKQLETLSEVVSELKVERCYGVEFDVTISTPTCTRIGSANLHKTLPIQNRMRGCLLDDDGNVVEYLDPNDWTTNVRDGSRGQVMVEIPLHYRKFETDGNKRRVLLSEYPLPGYDVVPLSYVSAYEASVQRSTNKLCSVVNTDADYRGGGNQSAYDSQSNTLLGRPATSISRTNFRNFARKRKADSTEWNCMTYDMQKTLYWLFVVEYATLNSQASYNSQLTAEGYRQGGLGTGVTILEWGKWSSFNGNNPFIPCGHTDNLGNRTGVVDYTMPTEYNATSVKVSVPRYRGIENPFGHILQWTDGVNIQISANEANGGDGLSKVFVCHDPAKFSDTSYNGYSHVGNEARNDGYIKEVIFGVGGEIVPKICAGGGSTTYFCDYHYTVIPTSGSSLRGLLFGGAANYGAPAGFAYANSGYAPSSAHASIGSRLCFIPRNRED